MNVYVNLYGRYPLSFWGQLVLRGREHVRMHSRLCRNGFSRLRETFLLDYLRFRHANFAFESPSEILNLYEYVQKIESVTAIFFL